MLFMLIALGIAFQLSRYTQKPSETQKFATHRNGGVNRTVRRQGMKILMVGGGSGGHVFPLIAIQQELNKILIVT
jgi:hypothetical protein